VLWKTTPFVTAAIYTPTSTVVKTNTFEADLRLFRNRIFPNFDYFKYQFLHAAQHFCHSANSVKPLNGTQKTLIKIEENRPLPASILSCESWHASFSPAVRRRNPFILITEANAMSSEVTSTGAGTTANVHVNCFADGARKTLYALCSSEFLPARHCASAGTSYGPVSVSLCLSVTSRCSIKRGERTNLVFGMDASFDQSYTVI